MVGRGKDVDDLEFLRAAARIEERVFVSSDLAEEVPIKQNQVNNRLNDLKEEGYVDFQWVGRAKAWWVTDEGWEYLEGQPNT